MARAAPYPCPRCERFRSPLESRPDPEFELGPTVWRRRHCPDCGFVWFTAEVRVSAREARRALARLTGDRRLFARLAGDGATVAHENGGPASRLPATASR